MAWALDMGGGFIDNCWPTLWYLVVTKISDILAIIDPCFTHTCTLPSISPPPLHGRAPPVYPPPPQVKRTSTQYNNWRILYVP